MQRDHKPEPTRELTTAAVSRFLDQVPARLHLAELPTPVERASWLDTRSARVWIKRDDRSSPLYGGGKVRKLEWILANRPHDEGPILSAGGVASHHLLALALFLAQQQRKLHALTFEQTMTEHAWRNLAVLLSAGAQLWHVRTRTRLPWAWLAYSTWHRPAERGTALQVGASTPLGCLGFIEAALELAQQIEQGELPRPDVVFVTAGTAGTCVGLALGFALARMATHIHIVSSVERWAFNRWLLAHKFGEVWRGLRAWGCKTTARHPKQLLAEAGITFALDHSQVGPGYGVPTASTERAITMAAAHGLGLEPTYTGKCVAGLQAALERGSLAGDVLFWHTHAGNDLRPMIRPGWHARLPAALRDRDIPRL